MWFYLIAMVMAVGALGTAVWLTRRRRRWMCFPVITLGHAPADYIIERAKEQSWYREARYHAWLNGFVEIVIYVEAGTPNEAGELFFNFLTALVKEPGSPITHRTF